MESRTSAIPADGSLPTEFNPSDYPMLDVYDSQGGRVIHHDGQASARTILLAEDWDKEFVDWGNGDTAMDVEEPEAETMGPLAAQAVGAAAASSMPPAPGSTGSFRRQRKHRSEEEWDSIKETIKDLYMNKGYTLATVKEILAKDHGFVASPKMFKSRLDRWGFHKNLNKKRYNNIIRNNAVANHVLRVVQATRITRYAKRTKSRAANFGYGPEQPGQDAPQLPDVVQEESMWPDGGILILPESPSEFRVSQPVSGDQIEIPPFEAEAGCASGSSSESTSGPRSQSIPESETPEAPRSPAARRPEPHNKAPFESCLDEIASRNCDSSSPQSRSAVPDHSLPPQVRAPDRSLPQVRFDNAPLEVAPATCIHMRPHQKKFRIEIEPRQLDALSHKSTFKADCWLGGYYDDVSMRLCPPACCCRDLVSDHAFEVSSRPGNITVRFLDDELRSIVSNCIGMSARGWVDGRLLLKSYGSLQGAMFRYLSVDYIRYLPLKLLVQCLIENCHIWKSYNIQELRDKGILDIILFYKFQTQGVWGGIHALDAGFQVAVEKQMDGGCLDLGMARKSQTRFEHPQRVGPRRRRPDDDNDSLRVALGGPPDSIDSSPTRTAKSDKPAPRRQVRNAELPADIESTSGLLPSFQDSGTPPGPPPPVSPVLPPNRRGPPLRIPDSAATCPGNGGENDLEPSSPLVPETPSVSPLRSSSRHGPGLSIGATVWAGNADRIREYAQGGAELNINATDPVLRVPPLHVAIMKSDVEMTELLLDLGADPNLHYDSTDLSSRSRRSPLTEAVATRNLELVRLLAQRGADVDQRLVVLDLATKRVAREMTPLALAVETQHQETVQVLLELGADIHKTSRTSAGAVAVTPLVLAARQGCTELFKLLLSWDTAFATGIKAANLNESDSHELTHVRWANDLISAAARGDLLAVLDLLELGVDVNSLSFRGTPLSAAAASEQTGAIRLLLDRGADVQLAALYLERSGLKHLAEKLVRGAYGESTDFDNLLRRFQHQFRQLIDLPGEPCPGFKNQFPDYRAAWAEGIRVMEGICRGAAPTRLAETLAFLAVARSIAEVLAAGHGDTRFVDAFDLDLMRWQQVFHADQNDLDGYRRVAMKMWGVILTDIALVDTDFDSLKTMEQFFELTSSLIRGAEEPLGLARQGTNGLEASFLRWQVRNAKPAEAELSKDGVASVPPPSPDGGTSSSSLVPSHDAGLVSLPDTTSPESRPLGWPPSPRFLPPDLDPPDHGWPDPGWQTESQITAEILLRGSIFSVVFIFFHGIHAISAGVLYIAAGAIGGRGVTPGTTWNMADRLHILMAFLASGIHTLSFVLHGTSSCVSPSGNLSSSSGNGASSASGATIGSRSRSSQSSSEAMARNWYAMIESGTQMWI